MPPKPIRLRPDGHPETGLQPTSFVAPDAVEGDPPKETGHVFFTNAEGNLTAGVWEATPYKEVSESYPVDELMVILSGSVTITDDEGHAETFSAGDAFVLPKGFKGTWENREPVRKYFVILE